MAAVRACDGTCGAAGLAAGHLASHAWAVLLLLPPALQLSPHPTRGHLQQLGELRLTVGHACTLQGSEARCGDGLQDLRVSCARQ